MGVNVSKASDKTVTAEELGISQTAYNSAVGSCISTSVGTNVLNISDSDISNSNISQKNAIQNLCIIKQAISDARKTNSQSVVLAKVAQNLEASGGLPGTVNVSEATKELMTSMKKKLNQDTINKIIDDCFANQDVKNILNISNSGIYKSDISQSNIVFAQCLMKNSIVSSVDANFASKFAAESEATVLSKGFLAIGGFQGLGGITSLSLLFCICIISILVLAQN
jgi:hypothetical protein